MCRSVTCRGCGKASWKGCGLHVDQVMRGVPWDQRCSCPAQVRPAAAGQSLFARLFGR